MDEFSQLTTNRAEARAPSSEKLNTVVDAEFEVRNPSRGTGWIGKAMAAIGAVVSFVYLANIGFGWAELAPDNIPGAGNIDEFLFSLLLIFCLQKLGINLLPLMRTARPAK